MSQKEIGRLTFTWFNKLYGHYKTDWSMEMRLSKANMTYDELAKKVQEREDWF